MDKHHHPSRRSFRPADRFARNLGWFSLALGATQLLAPRLLTRPLGMQGSEPWLRACGAREIISGVGLLSAGQRTPWVWARVAGDLVDLALLGRAQAQPSGALPWLVGGRSAVQARNLRLASAAVAGVTALDIGCAAALHASTMARKPPRDFSDRSGFAKPIEQMRGAARQLRHAPFGSRVQAALDASKPQPSQPGLASRERGSVIAEESAMG